jgi:hypothetical protein
MKQRTNIIYIIKHKTTEWTTEDINFNMKDNLPQWCSTTVVAPLSENDRQLFITLNKKNIRLNDKEHRLQHEKAISFGVNICKSHKQ